MRHRPDGRRHVAGLFSAASVRLAASLGAASVALASSGANAAQGSPRLLKGPYLQSLSSSSVEIRAELDAPGAVSVTLTATGDAGPPRTVRDDAPQAMHVVRVTGLAPQTHYAYALTVGGAVTKGELTTAPAPDSKAPFTFLVYGDNRTDEAAHSAIVRAMEQTPSDFIINTGDLVMDGSSEAYWQSFFDIEASLLRDRNVFACVGNHEITDGAGANYLRYFGPTCDARSEGAPPKLYGSFRWGDARFFLLDAMEKFDDGPERAWLDDELARADAETGLVWRIVVMHHGPWSSGPHGANARAVRAGLPALFAAHHVDIVLAGHDHIYERGYASGVRYVVSGGGGAPLYELKDKLTATRKAEAAHHFIAVEVNPTAIRMTARRDDGTVLERCGFAKTNDGWDCDPVAAPPMKSDPPTSPAPEPSSSRWGCAVGAPRGAPLLLAPAVAVLVTLARARRRRRVRS
jgi:predicted phosphodiesterase